jgi:hypothetical protein
VRLPVLGSAGWQLPYGSARPNVLQLVPAHTADFGAPLAGQEQDREQSCKGARPAVQPSSPFQIQANSSGERTRSRERVEVRARTRMVGLTLR